jgi:hypothetical protein
VYKAEDKAPQGEGAAAQAAKLPRARAAAVDASGAEAAPAAGRRRADGAPVGEPPRGGAQQPTAALEQLQEQELSIAQKKERIAAACTALLEAPERNVCELKVRQRCPDAWHFVCGSQRPRLLSDPRAGAAQAGHG